MLFAILFPGETAMGKQEEKIIAMQEQLLRNYEKQIAGLEEENKSLTELNETLRELLEAQEKELSFFNGILDKAKKKFKF